MEAIDLCPIKGYEFEDEFSKDKTFDEVIKHLKTTGI